jgi:hypothetical protein
MAQFDFFFVGAPKCGTTALTDWLEQNPEVLIADPREPNFFARDLVLPRAFSDSAAYHAQLAGREETIKGEGSTWNLYSQTAAQEIRDYNPDAKILIMLRNPVEVIHSLHNYRLYYGDETETDLARVLERESRHLEACARTGEPRDVMRIYRDVTRYPEGIRRYQERFEADQVKVALYEELVEAPNELIDSVQGFLGVRERIQPIFRQRNVGGTYKNQWLGRLFTQRPTPLRLLARVLPQSLRYRVGQRIRRANTAYGRKIPLDPGLKASLEEELRPDVERLETLLDRDLSHWRPASGAP